MNRVSINFPLLLSLLPTMSFGQPNDIGSNQMKQLNDKEVWLECRYSRDIYNVLGEFSRTEDNKHKILVFNKRLGTLYRYSDTKTLVPPDKTDAIDTSHPQISDEKIAYEYTKQAADATVTTTFSIDRRNGQMSEVVLVVPKHAKTRTLREDSGQCKKTNPRSIGTNEF